VKSRLVFMLALICIAAANLTAQVQGDVIGLHDLSPNSPGPMKGTLSGACLYCHAPHSGVGSITPLWNQKLSSATYTVYNSSTYVEKGNANPTLGQDSSLCLSCHDGTIAPGTSVAYKDLGVHGDWKTGDKLGTELQSSHPFSLVLPLTDAPDLVASLVSQGKTNNDAVKLVKGNIECTTCHNPHVQYLDKNNPNFLVVDSSAGRLCLACHDPNRSMPGKTNLLAGWDSSIHKTANNKTASDPPVGPYGSVDQNACSSCHAQHNATGPERLLRGANEKDCVACHSGGSNLDPVPLNVFAEFSKIGHPFTNGNSTHDEGEPALLNQNRHSVCTDCHNPHAAQKVATFTDAPGVRPSQTGVVGIDAADGRRVVSPAVNQYENCLRCHGKSEGKKSDPIYGYAPQWTASAADPLDVIPQFNSATSSHPVTHSRQSGFAQPSLRRQMLQLDGLTANQSRTLNQILCTDCHNSDDNREFAVQGMQIGPNGPHGSKWTHLFERRYEFSKAAAPGQTVTNLYLPVDLSINGPYALCGKCHDLNSVVRNESFSEHARHINDGFTCSACHTGHGIGGAGSNGNISGKRLVNFDLQLVAPNNGVISYDHGSNSCTLTCHNHPHQSGAGSSKRH